MLLRVACNASAEMGFLSILELLIKIYTLVETSNLGYQVT